MSCEIIYFKIAYQDFLIIFNNFTAGGAFVALVVAFAILVFVKRRRSDLSED
jgi:hypothetical protein